MAEEGEDLGMWVMYDYYQWLDHLNSSWDGNGTFNFTPIGSTEDPGIVWKEFIWIAVFYGLVFILGVIGNSLVVYCVTMYKSLKSITNQLLMSLAMADLLLILICVPVKFAELFTFGWGCGAVLCKLISYMQIWSMVTSVFTLTAISIERYYAISKPLRAKYLCTTKHARIVILSIWASACILSVPVLFVQEHYPLGYGVDQVWWCDEQWHVKGKVAAVSYEVYMLIVLFVVPVMVMVCMYAGVCIELWAVTGSVSQGRKLTNGSRKLGEQSETLMSTTSKKSSSSSKFSNESRILSDNGFRKAHLKEAQVRKQVLHMLIMVVLLFIICWGPLLCFKLAVAAEAILPYFPTLYPYAKPLETAFSLLAYFNSCLNPIVYGFMSRYFRKSFKQALSTCCIMSQRNQSSFIHTPYLQNDRSSSAVRNRRDDVIPTDQATKPNTCISSAAAATADSTMSRSLPATPDSMYPSI